MPSPNATRYVGYAGAAANWLIPISGLLNLFGGQPADNINAPMTMVLAAYSGVFFRWSIAISPANYPLMGCHIVNSSTQIATLAKYGLFNSKWGVARPTATSP